MSALAFGLDEEMPPEIRIDIYSGSFEWLGIVETVRRLELTDTFCAAGLVAFEVDDDLEFVQDLLRDDARIVATYTPDGEDAPAIVVSGPVEEVELVDEPAGEGDLDHDTAGGSLAFTVLGDLQILDTILGWPNPGGAITAQGDEGAYYTVTGPLETVIKQIVTANATRLDVPLVCAPDLGRGPNTTVQVRMHALADRLLPQAVLAGLGVRVVQDEAAGALVLDVWEPALYDDELTQASGSIASGTYRRSRAVVTRVVVGAGGEGTDRVFRQWIDGDAEALGARPREVFKDARDINTNPVENPGWLAQMEARAAETLAEGAARTGLRVELAETDADGIGRTLWLGDAVPVRLRGMARAVTDRIREVSVTWTPGAGLEVSSRIGEWTDDTTDDMYRLISDLMATRRDEGTR